MEETNWADSRLLSGTSVNGETARANAVHCFFNEWCYISVFPVYPTVVVMFMFLRLTLVNFLDS